MTIQPWKNTLSRWQILIFGALAIFFGVVIGVLVGQSTNILIPVAVTLGLVVILLALTNLEFSLLVFIFITYLRVSDLAVNLYHAPSIARPFFFLLVFAIALRWAITGNLPKGWGTPLLLVLAYGVIVFGSIFYAADFSSAQSAADDYWKDGLISVLIAALIQNKNTFKKVMWVLLLSGIFLGTISVFQYLTGTFSNNYYGFAQAPILQIVGNTQGNRVAGPIGDPNFFAQIMVVLVPIAINRMVYEKSAFLKLLAGYGLLVIALTVILTFSRGGFFALIVALGALTLYSPPRLPVLLALMGVAIVIFMLLPEKYVSRMATATDAFSDQSSIYTESSFRGRASEMITALLIFEDHPLIGVGVHNYPAYYQKYASRLGLEKRTTQREAHNLFLEIIAETGLLGILIFGTILVSIFKYIQNAREKLKISGDQAFRNIIGAFSAGLIGYLAAAMFIHGAYPRYFWLLAGIAFALPNILKDEPNSETIINA